MSPTTQRSGDTIKLSRAAARGIVATACGTLDVPESVRDKLLAVVDTTPSWQHGGAAGLKNPERYCVVEQAYGIPASEINACEGFDRFVTLGSKIDTLVSIRAGTNAHLRVELADA